MRAGEFSTELGCTGAPSAQAAEEKQREAGHLELRTQQLKEEVGWLTGLTG